jgi:peptide/nickel transport system permease protein
VSNLNAKVLSPTQETVIITSSRPPSFGKLVWKEIKHDKFALISFLILIAILVTVFIGASFIDTSTTTKVNLKLINKAPSAKFILGTDGSGRDMLTQVFLGARNSFLIAFGVTILCGIIGIIVGLSSGFFGGRVDNVIMRILDFYAMLPRLMFIIVIVSIIPKYNVTTFVLVMTAFGWLGDARLTRAKTLQQSSLDYVKASKTLGTNNFVIMFREVLPNIGSLIIVNLTLNLAANMGLETGLTFLGFGLPFSTPSLGTLISYASVPENMQNRPWQWLPASLLIVVMMLCINFVGQAVKRAADAKQRVA